MSDKPKIVVGIDGSDNSLNALGRAIEEAVRREAILHVVHVQDFTPATLHLSEGVTVNTTELAEAQRKDVWARAADLIDSAEATIEKIDLDGYPADALVDHCKEIDADLLVMGTRGRGRLAATFLGSTSLRALERAHCDVLIAKVK